MINKKEYDRKIIIIIALATLFFYYPIIYGGGFYADDVYRVNVIRKGFDWHYLGRHLATTIAQLYSNSREVIVDVSPLAWFISVSLLAASAKLIYGKLKGPFKRYALPLALVFLINPFFIENLLYRYDNLGMMMGLFLSVLAFSLPEDKRNFFIKTLLLLLALNFYQTFSNLYIASVVVLIILRASCGFSLKVIIRYFFYFFALLLIFYLFFQFKFFL